MNADLQERVNAVIAAYGGDETPGLPSRQAWAQMLAANGNQQITLINFFKFQARAVYPPSYTNETTDVSGREAFDRYAAVSGDCLSLAGGHFLLVAPFGGTFMGDDIEWDLIAIGTYPNAEAVLSLFEQHDYRRIYIHRVAACDAQRVSFCVT